MRGRGRRSATADDPADPVVPRPEPGLRWGWSGAALGAVYALPAAVAMTADLDTGLALAVGVLPAAIVGLPPTRRARRSIAVLGAFVGVPIAVGSVLANVPVLAVIGIFALAVGAAELAGRARVGQIAMVLGLPMVGVGLSYTELDLAAGLALLMVVGSLYASVVALLWPERPPPGPPPPLRGPGLGYGLRLGAAGATAATIGFALDLDHVGWACAAALLVMRPVPEMQQVRSIGRIVSVALGAALAIVWVEAEPSTAAYAVIAVVVVAGAAATRESRWYVTSAFTTYLVFLLLLHAAPDEAAGRFTERLLETVLGVGIAYLFGLALPRVLRARGRPTGA